MPSHHFSEGAIPMARDIYEQLLQTPRAQLVDLALAGLSRQGEMVARVLERLWGQMNDSADPLLARYLHPKSGPSPSPCIYLAGCGDSYFAAISARFAFEQLTGIPTVALESMELARYTLLPPDSLVILVSSGGQVSATLEAGRVARQAGAAVLGITGQKDSQMAQELPCLATDLDLSGSDPVDQVALMLGNFSFSFVALVLLAIHLGRRLEVLDDKTVEKIEAEIRTVPGAIDRAMAYSGEINHYLEAVSDQADFYFLGAGPSHGVALFYQAKFFEQAQRPVYGAQLEEFAHEQFFLLCPDKDTQVWLIAPHGHSRERARETITACRGMGAHTIAVTQSTPRPHDRRAPIDAHWTLAVPVTSEMFSPLVSVVPGELLGIHAFARWGGGPLSASQRRRQMAISKRLTREEV